MPPVGAAVAVGVDLDQHHDARSVEGLPLFGFAVEVVVQGDARDLAPFERLPVIGIAVAIRVLFEPLGLSAGAVEELLFEGAVAILVAGNALEVAVRVVELALVRGARPVAVNLGAYDLAVFVHHPAVDLPVVIAVRFRARQNVRLVVLPAIDVAIAVGVKLDQRDGAGRVDRLPLFSFAVEVVIQGNARHLALFEGLPLVGIAIAVRVLLESYGLLVGIVEQLLLEGAVAILVAGNALEDAVSAIELALVRDARAVGIHLGAHHLAVLVRHPEIHAPVKIAVLFQARQGILHVVLPQVEPAVAVGIEPLRHFFRRGRQEAQHDQS